MDELIPPVEPIDQPADQMPSIADLKMPTHAVDLFPREDIIKIGAALVTERKGATRIYFKFDCEKCQARCCFAEPNFLFEVGVCPLCKHETSISMATFIEVTNINYKSCVAGDSSKPTKKGKKHAKRSASRRASNSHPPRPSAGKSKPEPQPGGDFK